MATSDRYAPQSSYSAGVYTAARSDPKHSFTRREPLPVAEYYLDDYKHDGSSYDNWGSPLISAILSIVLGAIAFITPVPLLLPVIGLALGANGYIKEQRKEKEAQKTAVKVASIVGAIVCIAVLVLSFMSRPA